MKIACIYREQCFSPSSIDKDKAIMDAVASRLRTKGHDVTAYPAETVRLDDICHSAVILSMGRGDELLTMLEALEAQGTVIINKPKGIRLCSNRHDLDIMLRKEGIAVPPQDGDEGIWVKRGDGSAEIKDDVVLCHAPEEVESAILRMQQRGIRSWICQAHIPGDLVKFYGVTGNDGGFFTFSYPTDSGHSKFGLESANGKAHHFVFRADNLQQEADKIARLTGVTIYGGDAVVTEDGSFYIIDFNDWPTFSSCRDAAADAVLHHSELISHNSHR